MRKNLKLGTVEITLSATAAAISTKTNPQVMNTTRLLVRLALLALFTTALTTQVNASEGPRGVSATEALTRLKEGNQRFVASAMTHPDQTAEQRATVAKGQHPFAIVLTCADSRLSPEIIFDQGLGDLFVIRNAGNLLDDHVLASMEYAVEHLHANLIVVLGHTQCGAVSAAVAGGELPGHLPSIIASLKEAIDMAKQKPGDAVDNAVRINAKLEAAALNQCEPIIGEASKAGTVKIVAARYDIGSGEVEFFQ